MISEHCNGITSTRKPSRISDSRRTLSRNNDHGKLQTFRTGTINKGGGSKYRRIPSATASGDSTLLFVSPELCDFCCLMARMPREQRWLLATMVAIPVVVLLVVTGAGLRLGGVLALLGGRGLGDSSAEARAGDASSFIAAPGKVREKRGEFA